MSSKVVGVIIQVIAVVYGLFLLAQIGLMIALSLGVFDESGASLSLDIESILLPLPLWFLGDMLRDGNLASLRIAILLISSIVVVSTVFAGSHISLFGVAGISSLFWIIGIGSEALLIWTLLTCFQEMREKQKANQPVQTTATSGRL